MNKILFSLLLTFGVFNFGFAQENAFDDIDETPTEYQETNEVPVENEYSEETIYVVEEIKPSAVWQPTFEEALLKAKAEDKPILVYFTGSDWCGPCKRLEADVFSTEKFVEFSDENMVLYKADFPRNTDLVSTANKSMNDQLSARYNQSSFPTMVIINRYGNELGRKNGVYMSDSYFYFFEDIVRRYKI